MMVAIELQIMTKIFYKYHEVRNMCHIKVESVVFLFLDKLRFAFVFISIIIHHYSFTAEKACIDILITMLCANVKNVQCSVWCVNRLRTVVLMLKKGTI
jgi:hypothetical protein